MFSRMLGLARRLADDSLLLTRTCGPGVTARWLFEIARNLPACIRSHSLTPADQAVGEGPFKARLGVARARLTGPGVMGGIREIWARDVYLAGGFLEISDGDRVVDLGANAGNFTALALAHGPGVKVVSVEANPELAEHLRRNLELNGWTSRVDVVNAFIGGVTETQVQMKANPTVAAIPTVSESDFVERHHLTSIDFLKCDIEGSEFDLLGPTSRLLAISDQVAVEVHKTAGDAAAFVRNIQSSGFETSVRGENDLGLILLARRRG